MDRVPTPDEPGHYVVNGLEGEEIVRVMICTVDRTCVTILTASGKWFMIDAAGVGQLELSLVDLGDMLEQHPN